jgi:hypothetical protein
MRWWMLAASLLAAGFLTAVAILASHWPYSEKMVLPALQDTFKTNVSVQHFRRFYFPSPGCELDDVVLAHPENQPGAAPLATAARITITGRYFDLLLRPFHLAAIRVVGLQVRIPPASRRHFHASEGEDYSKVSVGSIDANDAMLEIENEDHKNPLRFQIHQLTLRSVAAKSPISFDVSMHNPVPDGELWSRGTFGPWVSGALERTPLHGKVTLTHAKLDGFSAIAGTLQSDDKFGGTLAAIDVLGDATSPDFHLKKPGHKIALKAQFHVIVDALKGEAKLREVTGELGRTPFRVQGTVATNAKLGRRETSLDFNVGKGRVQDVLWLFNSAANPPMMGPASGTAHVRVPKFGSGFVKSLELDGSFEISDGHFQKETQAKVNRLSARAQGLHVNDDGGDAPEVAVEALDSNVRIRDGSVYFLELFFLVPGAHARMQGTYHLEDHHVNLHGDLWTIATFSKDATGIKTILLKPMDPLFKRKHAGARVGVTMTGYVDNPAFGVSLTHDKNPDDTTPPK